MQKSDWFVAGNRIRINDEGHIWNGEAGAIRDRQGHGTEDNFFWCYYVDLDSSNTVYVPHCILKKE